MPLLDPTPELLSTPLDFILSSVCLEVGINKTKLQKKKQGMQGSALVPDVEQNDTTRLLYFELISI